MFKNVGIVIKNFSNPSSEETTSIKNLINILNKHFNNI